MYVYCISYYHTHQNTDTTKMNYQTQPNTIIELSEEPNLLDMVTHITSEHTIADLMNHETQSNTNEQSNIPNGSEAVTSEGTIANLMSLAELCNIPIINVTSVEGEQILSNTPPANNEVYTENSFVCYQLAEQYGSNEADLLELNELLFSWNLVDLFPYFQSKLYFYFILIIMHAPS